MKLDLKIPALAVILFFASCSSSKKTSSATNETTTTTTTTTTAATTTPDGSSMEKAIIVNNISEEYAYVRKVCPECKLKKQVLTSRDKKYYDLLYFTKDGKEVVYYFDINSFYGKLF